MEEAAGTALLMIGAKGMDMRNEVASEGLQRLATVMFALLQLFSSLTKALFLSPPSACALIKTRAAVDKITS